MRTVGMWRLFIAVAVAAGGATSVVAQEPQTREAAIEQEQADKDKILHPYVPGKVEGDREHDAAARIHDMAAG